MLFVTHLFDGTTVTGSTGQVAFTTGTPGGVSMSLAGLSPARTAANHSIGVRKPCSSVPYCEPRTYDDVLIGHKFLYCVFRVRGSVPKNQELRTITLAPWGWGSAGS